MMKRSGLAFSGLICTFVFFGMLTDALAYDCKGKWSGVWPNNICTESYTDSRGYNCTRSLTWKWNVQQPAQVSCNPQEKTTASYSPATGALRPDYTKPIYDQSKRQIGYLASNPGTEFKVVDSSGKIVSTNGGSFYDRYGKIVSNNGGTIISPHTSRIISPNTGRVISSEGGNMGGYSVQSTHGAAQPSKSCTSQYNPYTRQNVTVCK